MFFLRKPEVIELEAFFSMSALSPVWTAKGLDRIQPVGRPIRF